MNSSTAAPALTMSMTRRGVLRAATSSGFGLAAAYVGSVMLLLVVYFGFISGKGVARGLLHVSAGDGVNVHYPESSGFGFHYRQ